MVWYGMVWYVWCVLYVVFCMYCMFVCLHVCTYAFSSRMYTCNGIERNGTECNKMHCAVSGWCGILLFVGLAFLSRTLDVGMYVLTYVFMACRYVDTQVGRYVGG
jgi:hypothetical protein